MFWLMYGLAAFACADTPIAPIIPGDASAVRDTAAAPRDNNTRDTTTTGDTTTRKDSLPKDTTPPQGQVNLGIQSVVTGMASPVYLAAPAGDSRLFIVEQGGRIRIVKGGQLLTTPFLDITDLVQSGGERGLLSVAFHPQYGTNGYFYVYYTDASGDIRIERYHVGPNPDVADAGSAMLILTIDHATYSNHNGGLLRFGPDGMLYAGTGDGGASGDPNGNGQNQDVLLAKLLRLDVDHGDPYAVPPDNPFVSSGRGEVWAYGLRNPWRYAFDRVTGLLYIADVGQNIYEEVNVMPASTAGVNYGWKTMEGRHCYQASTCNQAGLTLPVVEYDHDSGCSITGGAVYRGWAIPEIAGLYFYSDYCSGWLRSFRYANGLVTDQKTWSVGSLGMVVSFGEDGNGELYILSASGSVYKIIRK